MTLEEKMIRLETTAERLISAIKEVRKEPGLLAPIGFMAKAASDLYKELKEIC